jgi:predicted DCC family thiol-disulfide oxidoreductase YuxK
MKQLTVWYDSACPLCPREIALMRRLDRRQRINFVDAVDPETVCPLNRDDILARFHAEENGKLLSGAAAFAAMWRVIPLLWPLGMFAKLPGALPILEWVYRQFLRVRPRLQRFFQ